MSTVSSRPPRSVAAPRSVSSRNNPSVHNESPPPRYEGAIGAILNPRNGYSSRDEQSAAPSTSAPSTSSRARSASGGKKEKKNYARENVMNLRKQQELIRLRAEEDDYVSEQVERVLDKLNKHKDVGPRTDSNRRAALSRDGSAVQGEYGNENMNANSYQGSVSTQRNFIQENARSIARAIPPAAAKAQPPALSVNKKDYGKTPRYLQVIKSELQSKIEQKRREEEAAKDDGLVLMPDEERLQTLQVLEAKKVEILSALHRLPIRIETPSAIRRQNELEGQLREVEDAITIFSRKQVFISNDS